jgi:tetratricopeptide (TPR) repeat protein
MTDDELAAAADRALAAARTRPSDGAAQLAAACALDRVGREAEALPRYQAALDLGVPGDERRRALVGYGSTLRNCGRIDDAIARLGEAVVEFPDYPALRCFLALALHSGGHRAAALATLLDVVLELEGGALDGYHRALHHYHGVLLDEASR